MSVEFVPIGSECSVAYHLGRLKLRNVAYPFDHARTPSLSGVNQVIEDNFYKYCNFTKSSSKRCYQYVKDDDFAEHNITDDTIILKNSYNISFPHDYLDSNDTQLDNIVGKYNRRINRFKELDNLNKRVIFVWYEQTNTKEHDVINFNHIIHRKFPNLVFNLLIIAKSMQSFHHDNTFIMVDDTDFLSSSPPWQRNNLDWEIIFGLRSKITMRRDQVCSKTIHSKVSIALSKSTEEGNIKLLLWDEIVQDVYLMNNYKMTIDHFSQPNKYLHQQLDIIVSNWLSNSNSNYIGFSGLSGYYAHRNRDKLKIIKCYSHTQNVVDVGISNSLDFKFSKLYNINFTIEHPDIDISNTILLVNSRKINVELCNIANAHTFEKIIYITCSKNHSQLVDILDKYRVENKITLIGIDTLVFVYHFIPIC